MQGSANNVSASSGAPLRLYQVYRWGNDYDGDGPNGNDTNFLVRARSHTTAVALVDPILKEMKPRDVADYAHGVIELGTSFDPHLPEEELEQVLRGPFLSFAYRNRGLPHWHRDCDENPLLASGYCSLCGHDLWLNDKVLNCPDCGRSRLAPAHYPIATPRMETCARRPGEKPFGPVVSVDGYLLFELFIVSEHDPSFGTLTFLHTRSIAQTSLITCNEEIRKRGASGAHALAECHPLAVDPDELKKEQWYSAAADRELSSSSFQDKLQKIGCYPHWIVENVEEQRLWRFLGPCPKCHGVIENDVRIENTAYSWCPHCQWSRPSWASEEVTAIEYI